MQNRVSLGWDPTAGLKWLGQLPVLGSKLCVPVFSDYRTGIMQCLLWKLVVRKKGHMHGNNGCHTATFTVSCWSHFTTFPQVELLNFWSSPNLLLNFNVKFSTYSLWILKYTWELLLRYTRAGIEKRPLRKSPCLDYLLVNSSNRLVDTTNQEC
jgi:hypothetical protein